MLPKSDVVAVLSLKPQKRKDHVVALNQRLGLVTVAYLTTRVRLPIPQLQGFMAAMPIQQLQWLMAAIPIQQLQGFIRLLLSCKGSWLSG